MIYVDKYTNNKEKVWDDFVYRSRNGSIFNTRRFLNYHGSRFKDNSLIFYNKDNIICILPSIVKNRKLISHSGASVGGLIISKECGIQDIEEIIMNLELYLLSNSFNFIQITIPPYIYNTFPCDEIEFILKDHGFSCSRNDLSCCIKLTVDNIKDSTMRSVRKAINGDNLILEKDSNRWKEYWTILESNLKTKYDVSPTHTIDEILFLKNTFKDKIRLDVVTYSGKIIAGVVLFLVNSSAFEVFYIAQDYEFQNKRALNMLIYNSMLFGKMNSFTYMNLGVSTENGGKNINWGLFKFKEGFGGRGILRKTYYKEY